MSRARETPAWDKRRPATNRVEAHANNMPGIHHRLLPATPTLVPSRLDRPLHSSAAARADSIREDS